jgi:hypothetical protein
MGEPPGCLWNLRHSFCQTGDCKRLRACPTVRGSRCTTLSGVRVAALLANHPRWEPYAVMFARTVLWGRSALVVPNATDDPATVSCPSKT